MKSISLYLEKIDPYFTQRLILYKSLYIVTIFVYIDWIFHIKTQFIAHTYTTALVATIYENPLFTSYKEKKFIFVITYFTIALGSVLFYMVFQYKLALLFVSLGFFGTLYVLYIKYIPKLRAFVVLFIVICSMNMSYHPTGIFQIATSMFGTIMLSMIICYLSIISFPNIYHKVWQRAFILYLAGLTNILNIDSTNINSNYIQLMLYDVHFKTMHAYRKLVKKSIKFNVMRINFSINNMFIVATYLVNCKKNTSTWSTLNQHIQKFYNNIKKNCTTSALNVELLHDLTKVELYFIKHLNITIDNWNKLCRSL